MSKNIKSTLIQCCKIWILSIVTVRSSSGSWSPLTPTSLWQPGALQHWTLSNICKGLCVARMLENKGDSYPPLKSLDSSSEVILQSYKSSDWGAGRRVCMVDLIFYFFFFCTVVLSACSSVSSSRNILASPLKLYSSITGCFTSWTDTLTCCTYFL